MQHPASDMNLLSSVKHKNEYNYKCEKYVMMLNLEVTLKSSAVPPLQIVPPKATGFIVDFLHLLLLLRVSLHLDGVL